MAGGLHGLDMQKRVRMNEDLRKLGYYKSEIRTGHSSKELSIEPVSKEVLDDIRVTTLKEQAKETRRKSTALVLIVALVSILFTLALLFS